VAGDLGALRTDNDIGRYQRLDRLLSRLQAFKIANLCVPDDLDKALERQSAAMGISKSDLAREALKRYLRVAAFRTLRSRLVARAQAGGINTDDDVFEVLQKK
jgi:hypothetical protein